MGDITHSHWHTPPTMSDDFHMCISGSFLKKSHVITHNGARVITVK